MRLLKELSMLSIRFVCIGYVLPSCLVGKRLIFLAHFTLGYRIFPRINVANALDERKLFIGKNEMKWKKANQKHTLTRIGWAQSTGVWYYRDPLRKIDDYNLWKRHLKFYIKSHRIYRERERESTKKLGPFKLKLHFPSKHSDVLLSNTHWDWYHQERYINKFTRDSALFAILQFISM